MYIFHLFQNGIEFLGLHTSDPIERTPDFLINQVFLLSVHIFIEEGR